MLSSPGGVFPCILKKINSINSNDYNLEKLNQGFLAYKLSKIFRENIKDMTFIQAGNSLQKLVFNIGGPGYENLLVLAFGWKHIVGKLLAERSWVQKLDNNILFVSTTNNVWMQELILRKIKLIQDIESKFKIKLNDIIFFLRTREIEND